MSFNKEAYIRYTIIDACVTNKQKPFPSMEELMEACERKIGSGFSISAIQKDIKAMKEDEALGFLAPIKFSKSRNGYYYTDPEYSIRKISLHESDIEALKATADMISMYSGSRVSENFNNAVHKIFASIHERFPEENGKRKIVQIDSSPNHKGFEHFEFFLHAAKEKIPVCFVHYSYTNRAFKSVIVHPLILKEFQNNWYVVGFSENHRELRTFGLDRIYDPKLLKLAFKEPENKKITEDYFKNIYGVYPLPGKELQEIVFYANPLFSDYLYAHPIHESQRRDYEAPKGQGVFRLKLIPSQELVNYFISFAQNIVVAKPLWLRNEVGERIKKSLVL